jgi:hypothetical protein
MVFGQGTGPVWLNKLGCHGNEMSILQCSQSQYGNNVCHHSLDIGLICMNDTGRKFHLNQQGL